MAVAAGADGVRGHEHVHDGVHVLLLRGFRAREGTVPTHQSVQGADGMVWYGYGERFTVYRMRCLRFLFWSGSSVVHVVVSACAVASIW